MNFKFVLRIISHILLVEVALMAPSLFISLFLHERSAKAFLMTMGINVIIAIILYVYTRNAKKGRFYAREGLVTTSLTWILMSLLGALPFYFSGFIPNYVDAFFETVSGFTTTGSSILLDIESLDKGLLFWRSFTHWIGGMGVLVFLMSIVSLGNKNQGFSLHILRAESPGPTVGKMVPRMKKTAEILYILYFALTFFNVVFLVIGGMSLFEACCTAFGTAGTGGFGIKNDSLTSYSPYIQYVTTVFMLLFSINFSIYYILILKKFKEAFKDEEFKLFWFIVISSILIITINVHKLYPTLSETFRNVAFSVASIISTTGYGIADFNLWPSLSKSILVILMLLGACAGSTGGGLKQIRLLLLIKSLRKNLHKSLHPSEVKAVLVNGKAMDDDTLQTTNAYLIAYVFIIVLSFLIISLDGFSFETNLTAIIATFNNIGPGLDMVGPTGNYAAFSNMSKLVMCADMLAGRLEIYPMLILLSKTTWKRAR